MNDKNSLNEKYQKFEPEEAEAPVEESAEKPNKKIKEPKEKKVKEPKPPKEKKVKEPKPPKEKKVKEPKPPKEKKVKEPKPPKEKKVKEPKPPKEKKVKEPKPSKEKKIKEPKEPKEKKVKEPKPSKEKKIKEPKEPKEKKPKGKKNAEKSVKDIAIAPEITEETVAIEALPPEKPTNEPEKAAEAVENGRIREEISFDMSSDSKIRGKSEKSKKAKKEKTPKEKKVKSPKEPKEKKPHDPLEKKDFATIITCVVALMLAGCLSFAVYFNSVTIDKRVELVSKIPLLGKILPEYVAAPNESNTPEDNLSLSKIQVAREGILVNLMPTDFPRVFYGVNTDYSVQYYQYSKQKVIPVKYTDTINLKVDMGSGILNLKMNYIKDGEFVSGIGVFTSDSDKDTNYFYDLVVFKLTVLPAKYRREGHALLLATTDKNALENSDVLWTESFDVNLNDGTMTRFLSVINRTIDEKGSGIADFCMLNQAGYTSIMQEVPFVSAREYPVGAGLQDVFVKSGNTEKLLASDIYGRFVTLDGSKITYLRKTTTGFDVIHNVSGNEKIARSFYGFMETSYMINNEYLLSKEDGKLYNIISGKEYSLVGYAMNAASFIVSSDRKYVVMMGTVKNAVDYQIHIFDLQTGEYAKFRDKNYAPHGTLCFIDDKTVLYTAIDPNQGYEYVVLDLEKAFEQTK